MRAPIRRQSDDLQDAYSAATVVNTTDRPDLTRQEFTKETDVNWILARMGLGAQLQNQALYTETDYDVDLQQALNAVTEARQSFQNLPAEVRERFPTIADVLRGIETGELTSLDPAPTEQPAVTPSASEGGASPAP